MKMRQLDKLGKVVLTQGALRLPLSDLLKALERHKAGDWGDITVEDKIENNLAVQQGFRVMSVYRIQGEAVWILTEADRSSTTVLLPEEY